ncbi:MAG: hypothetical protein JNJ71_19045 [Rubrivivax sp.]|nr:hypothetical protein [Rubrivivax sp.]
MGRVERVLLVLWPAFVMAGVLEALVFVVVDPESLTWFGGPPVELSRQAVYTISFLIFWAVIAAASAASALLASQNDRLAESKPGAV